MINLPSDYSSAKGFDGSGGPKLTPGGHICRTRTVELAKTRNGSDMLVVNFDIVEEGEFKEYYGRIFDSRIRYNAANAKWPGVFRTTISTKDGKTNGFFKGLIEAIEASNPGYSFTGTGNNEITLQGKLLGFNFGEEEYPDRNTGEIKIAVKPQYAVSVAKVREGVIPPARKLYNPQSAAPGYSGGQPNRNASVPGIMQQPRNQQQRMDLYNQGDAYDDDDDELPF